MHITTDLFHFFHFYKKFAKKLCIINFILIYMQMADCQNFKAVTLNGIQLKL